MANPKKFNVNLNLQQQEIQNAVAQNLSTAPSSPKEGEFYYNSVDKLFYVYNGTTWLVATVKDASTTVKGIVQLSNTYNGTSQTLATTEKALNDGLNTKQNLISSPTNNNIVTTNGSGQTQDSGKVFSTDGTMAGNSDDNISTEKAIVTYVDSKISGVWNFRDSFDASGGSFPSTGGSGTSGAIKKGDLWVISVAGTLGTMVVNPSDIIIAKVNTPGQTESNWGFVEGNLGYTPENVANKETSALDTSTTKYPCNNVVKVAVDAKLTANSSITGATKTKITYDSKGLITSGTDATTADISDSTDKRYVTDADLLIIADAFQKSTDTASDVINTPSGSITSTNVQDALNELDTLISSGVGRYEASFLSSDFSSGTLTVSALTHGLGTGIHFDVRAYDSSNIENIGDPITNPTTGQVTYSVAVGLEFDGTIVITK